MLSRSNGDRLSKSVMMTADEVAKYLEVEAGLISEWVNSGRLPGIKEGDSWRFDRAKIDAWVAEGKIK
jgi:excisionase family DNA binding protein